MKNKVLLLIYMSIIIVLVGCGSTIETTERIPEMDHSSFEPLTEEDPVIEEDPVTEEDPLIEEDPLMDLEPEEFEREYAKLPDNYKIKIKNIKKFEKYLCKNNYDPIKVSKEGTITKKQAEKINRVDKDEYKKRWDSLSLKGLRYFRNLEYVTLYRCHLSELKELKYFSKLSDLDLVNCGLENIDFLNECPDLIISGIGFYQNNISNIGPLANRKELYALGLSGNQIIDITPLSSLNQLKSLVLNDNQITDITPLSKIIHPYLMKLYLNDNQIKDITALSNLECRDALNLDNNQITDITPLSNIKEIVWLTLSNNPIRDISPLKDLKFDDEDGAAIDLTNTNVDYALAKELFGKYLIMDDKE